MRRLSYALTLSVTAIVGVEQVGAPTARTNVVSGQASAQTADAAGRARTRCRYISLIP
jgi:hypothetical protein